jgi:hypothetical protein
VIRCAIAADIDFKVAPALGVHTDVLLILFDRYGLQKAQILTLGALGVGQRGFSGNEAWGIWG